MYPPNSQETETPASPSSPNVEQGSFTPFVVMGVVVVDASAAVLIRNVFISIFSSFLGLLAAFLVFTASTFWGFIAIIFMIGIPFVGYRALKVGDRRGLTCFSISNFFCLLISILAFIVCIYGVATDSLTNDDGDTVSTGTGVVYILCYLCLAFIFGLASFRTRQLLQTMNQRPIWVLSRPQPPLVSPGAPQGAVIGAPVGDPMNPYAAGLGNAYGTSAFDGPGFSIGAEFDDDDEITRAKKSAHAEFAARQQGNASSKGLLLADPLSGADEEFKKKITKQSIDNEDANTLAGSEVSLEEGGKAIVDLLGVESSGRVFSVEEDDDLNVYKQYGEDKEVEQKKKNKKDVQRHRLDSDDENENEEEDASEDEKKKKSQVSRNFI